MDEALFHEATTEYENGLIDAELMAKAAVMVDGDDQKKKYKYISLRVERLKLEKRKRIAAAAVDGGKIAGPALVKLILAPLLLALCILLLTRMLV